MTHAMSITTIDANYIHDEIAAIYMLTKDGHAAFIDTGTNHSLDNVQAAMTQNGIKASQVDYVILTHIHLDHAGGASQMIQQFPNAQLVVHPFGSRHMIDPSKLISGTKAVYGDKKFAAIYGEILPIDSSRVIESTDGMSLDFLGETLSFLDTPGHAKHHHCILHAASGSCFTGDTLGLAYPILQNTAQDKVSNTPCLLPTTTPVQFSPADLHASIDKVMAHQPLTLYPTHYGPVRVNTTAIAKLHEHIDAFVMLAEQHYKQGDHESALQPSILEYMVTQACDNNPQLDAKSVEKHLATDAKLNTQGLLVWLTKKYSR